MFEKLLSWLREKARLLFGENTSVSASVSSKMESAVSLWAQMYDMGGPWCHGGQNPLYGLGLPRSIAAELARLTTLEMECLVSGSDRASGPGRVRLRTGLCAVPPVFRCTGPHSD